MDVFEAMHTQRAMRRLLPDDISDEDVWTVLDAAIHAPNGGNRQPWNFLVVREAEAKRKIGEYYLDAWKTSYGPLREAMLADVQMAKTYHSADHLANHLAEAPVLIVAMLRIASAGGPGTIAGASIYPAVQNLMLAARALGLGTTLTTLHKLHEQEVKELLGIPEKVETMALIPLGRPKGRFGTPTRIPVEKVVYWDRWGESRSRG